ncbi:MAG: hypothetical protein ICV73_23170, partial [Acetobacteraceae bacterium]|nr:hypothetical protein [Acetobacteraceae bacterium]
MRTALKCMTMPQQHPARAAAAPWTASRFPGHVAQSTGLAAVSDLAMAMPTGSSLAPIFSFERTYPERRTAGTGGIERIETRFDMLGAFTAKITGRLLESIPREAAPNYNRLYPNRRMADLQPALADHFRATGRTHADAEERAFRIATRYEAAHLWGLGFGDEAAAGIMWAPVDFNQGLQNRLLEKLQRRWHAQLASKGHEVRLEAVAVAFTSEALRSRGIEPRLKFLEEVQYKVTVMYPSGRTRSHLFGADVGPSSTDPGFGLTTFSFHAFDELSELLR